VKKIPLGTNVSGVNEATCTTSLAPSAVFREWVRVVLVFIYFAASAFLEAAFARFALLL
jgi:hypothetical protein